MRQTIAAGLFLLMLLFLPPWLRAEEPAPQEDTSPQPLQTQQAAPEDGTGPDAAHTLRLWDGSAVQTLTAAEYLPGVVRGEMPATFELEALKAQAVAERTYLYYRMTGGEKAAHPDADVCTDSNLSLIHICGVHRNIRRTPGQQLRRLALHVLALHQEGHRHTARVQRPADHQRAFRDEQGVGRVGPVYQLVLRQPGVDVQLRGVKIRDLAQIHGRILLLSSAAGRQSRRPLWNFYFS